MPFITDKQTLEDLNIFNRSGNSVFDFFNACQTQGGEAMMEEMFLYPLSETRAINQRVGIISQFAQTGINFPFTRKEMDIIVAYLSNRDERSRMSGMENGVRRKIASFIAKDGDTELIYKGIEAIANALTGLKIFIESPLIAETDCYEMERRAISELLNNDPFSQILHANGKKRFTESYIISLDAIFRFKERDKILELLQYIYRLDVYVTVAKIAKKYRLCYPRAVQNDKVFLFLQGVYHLKVENPVSANITIDENSNVIFLTGANMAGKSTFMKALSLALFLAQIGFPVPASQMDFSPMEGLYTTINLPDNLGMGASHFYAEVLRVKKMAKELIASKKLFILFDELFRGTNVKDAYEATIAITEAFAKKKNSMFVISTHIVEAGEVLKERCGNIQFLYLPTCMKANNTPEYTYKLQNGITEDRHGMMIVKNEGILDILLSGIASCNTSLPELHRNYTIKEMGEV